MIIEKTVNSPEPLIAPSEMDYRIVVRNEGSGPAYDVVLTDIVRDAGGGIVKRKSWNLGEIAAGGETIVTHSIVFGIDAAGIYANTTELTGFKGFPAPIGDSFNMSIPRQWITVAIPELPEGWSFSATTDEPEDPGIWPEEPASSENAAETPAAVAQNITRVSAPAPSLLPSPSIVPSPLVSPAKSPEIENVFETEATPFPSNLQEGSDAVVEPRLPEAGSDTEPSFLASVADAGYEMILGALALLGGAALFLIRRFP